MEVIEIPGYGTYEIEHVVFDYNGTLAENGRVCPRILKRLEDLTRRLAVHVATADTFGTVREMFAGTNLQVEIISREKGPEDKRALVASLGRETTLAVGNGYNDRLMLETAALGFCVIGPEGASSKALMSSDVVLGRIEDFFDLMEDPRGLIATLRG